MENMKFLSLMVKKLWPKLKVKICTSKVIVKVTRSKLLA